MLVTTIIFVLIGILAYQDVKSKKISDVFIIFLWFMAFIFGDVYWLTLSFILFWLINTIIKKNRFGWGDILAIPPIIALIPYNFYSLIALVTTVLVLVMHYILRKEKEVPVMLFAFMFYAFYLLFILLFFLF